MLHHSALSNCASAMLEQSGDLQVDNDTMDMLRVMNMANLPGVKLQQVQFSSLPSVSSAKSIRVSRCRNECSPDMALTSVAH